jgi:hypothetical protein
VAGKKGQTVKIKFRPQNGEKQRATLQQVWRTLGLKTSYDTVTPAKTALALHDRRAPDILFRFYFRDQLQDDAKKFWSMMPGK